MARFGSGDVSGLPRTDCAAPRAETAKPDKERVEGMLSGMMSDQKSLKPSKAPLCTSCQAMLSSVWPWIDRK